MKIILDTRKSAQENAQSFFNEAKKLREKVKGTGAGMREVKKKLEELEKQAVSMKKKGPEVRRPKEWFEKFRWCFTQNGLLVIGGRDAHSNESIVKHYLDKQDWYFHADTHGAPHCVLKVEKKTPEKGDFEDAASFAGVFSSVWKKGLFSVRVYKVSPSQVSKKAPSGESLGKGAFMIYGEREWFDPSLRLGWGVQEVKDGFRIICGPLSCVSVHAQHVMEIAPGEKSKSDIAKFYARFLSRLPIPVSVSLDELIASLPPGEFSFKPHSSK
jgi:predicted ribosome quality control (RQC) complex YloA/Tae2 family protein